MLSLEDIQAVTYGIEEDPDMVEKFYPAVVKGRVAHIDADFLAYMSSYERKDDDFTMDDIIYRTNVMIEDKRLEAAAETAVLHLTPNTSDKGGRYEVAIQKQYQGQRTSDSKPRYLEAVRTYMGSLRGTISGRPWENAEADDGMAEAAWQAWRDGTADQCIIVTKDKDLRMCPGLHLNWDTGNVTDCGSDAFGWIDILERPSKPHKDTGKVTIKKKHDGFGTKFFWLQLLMGDTADNIKGCPHAMIGGNKKPVGLVGAYELLKDATSDKECLRICMDAYKINDYTHYLTSEAATWQDVFWSEAQMLWMQRTPGDINDVKKWVKEFLT